MPMPNPKNAGLLGGAAADLGGGLGDLTSQELSDEEKERRKKLMQANGGKPVDPMAMIGQASKSLMGY